MDGLDRLVEMLEKRFGRFWADALLLCAVLGAAAWGIHSFVIYFVLPAITLAISVYSYVSGVHVTLPSNINEIIKDSTFVIVWGLAILTFLQAGLSAAIRRLQTRNWENIKLQLVEYEKMVATYKKAIATLLEREAEYKKNIEVLEKENAVLAAVKAEAPSPPPLQDTEGSKQP